MSNLQTRKLRYTEVKATCQWSHCKKIAGLYSNQRLLRQCDFLTRGQHLHHKNLLSLKFHTEMIFVVLFMWRESRVGQLLINTCARLHLQQLRACWVHSYLLTCGSLAATQPSVQSSWNPKLTNSYFSMLSPPSLRTNNPSACKAAGRRSSTEAGERGSIPE